MLISKKTAYALQAVFELACRPREVPVSIAELAASQRIPPRFLEAILAQLRRAGVVRARRGKNGGYLLVHSPTELTVHEVVTAVQGPPEPQVCVCGEAVGRCASRGGCAFSAVWQRLGGEMREVLTEITFAELVIAHRRRQRHYVPDYII